MTPSARIWLVLAVLYAAFFGWYTSFGGPLTDEEIARYMSVLEQRAEDGFRLETWRRFMETDTGDDFAMLNAIHMRDTPLAVPGVEPGDTSREVMSRYSEPFLGRAFRSAAHPVAMGTAAATAIDLWGIEGAEKWTDGGLVRYRSRRDLMEQAVAVGPSGIHAFKEAALEKTIAYPLDPWFHLGDPRILLALVLVIVGLALQLRLAARR